MSSSPFVIDWIDRLARERRAGARALDVAMGRGRYAVRLALAGFRTFGVDAALDVVIDAKRTAHAAGASVHGFCADLTAHPLPESWFEVVLVSRYLQRDLFRGLRATVAPGGVAVYETFTVAQRRLGTGPKSPDHLLEPGELLRRFEGFEVLCYEEVTAPDAVARIVARRPA
jgi:SAM-dependent methyltransferase